MVRQRFKLEIGGDNPFPIASSQIQYVSSKFKQYNKKSHPRPHIRFCCLVFYMCFSHFEADRHAGKRAHTQTHTNTQHENQHRKFNKQTQNINFITPLCLCAHTLFASGPMLVECRLKQGPNIMLCYVIRKLSSNWTLSCFQ